LCRDVFAYFSNIISGFAHKISKKMAETPLTRAQELKRSQEEQEKGAKKVPLKLKFDRTWEYILKLKELQELEGKIAEVEKYLEKKEEFNPDLKALRGNVEHQVRATFWEVDLGSEGKRTLAGKSYEDAKEKFLKRTKAEKVNSEKQKTEKGSKKPKMEVEQQ